MPLRRWPKSRCSQASEPSVPPDYDARDYRAGHHACAGERHCRRAPRRRRCHHATKCWRRAHQLPELRLDLHVYDPNPAKRFVFINMRKLREGESLPEGVRVDQITPTGAELSYRGTHFTIDGN